MTVLETISGLFVCFYIDIYEQTLLSWDKMAWNITGDVSSGVVSSEKLCKRLYINTEDNCTDNIFALITDRIRLGSCLRPVLQMV